MRPPGSGHASGGRPCRDHARPKLVSDNNGPGAAQEPRSAGPSRAGPSGAEPSRSGPLGTHHGPTVKTKPYFLAASLSPAYRLRGAVICLVSGLQPGGSGGPGWRLPERRCVRGVRCTPVRRSPPGTEAAERKLQSKHPSALLCVLVCPASPRHRRRTAWQARCTPASRSSSWSWPGPGLAQAADGGAGRGWQPAKQLAGSLRPTRSRAALPPAASKMSN